MLMNNLIPVYFPTVGATIEITFRFFDRLLHENMLVNINGKWIETH